MARMIVPLTAKQVKDAKAKDKQYKLYDGNGLQLCVHVTGNKVWRFDYHDHNKKRKTYTIGDANLITLAEARLKRDELRILLNSGESIQNSSTSTFNAVFNDWYSRWSQTVTKRHAERALNAMECDVFPKIGNMDIDKIEPKHIVDSLLEVEQRESLEQLIKTKSSIKMCFDFAVARGICKFNPVVMVSNKAFKSKKKKNHKSVDKDKIYQFFEFFENERFSPSVRLCTEFVLRSMTRVSESAQAEWSEYDKDNGYLIIPADRMKMEREHIIPLVSRCIEILDEVKGQSAGMKYIFPNSNFTSHLSETYPLTAIKRHGIDSTIHGLRNLASTILNETGLFRSDVIEACLAHQDKNTIRGTYNKAQYLEERKEALQWWSDFIDMCKTKEGNAQALKKFKII